MPPKYVKDFYFSIALDLLLKINDKQEFKQKLREIENYIVAHKNILLAAKLALELDAIGLKSKKMENLIIKYDDGRYILRYAKYIDKADIPKLQNAIIARGNILQITEFACFVKGSDTKLIEEIISRSDNAKAAYLFIRFVKTCNIDKFKHIIFKSKRPRYIFALAKKLLNKEEIMLAQDLILNSSSYTYMRLFAAYIKDADIEKLEDKIIQSKNIIEMKRFYKSVKSRRLGKLILLL